MLAGSDGGGKLIEEILASLNALPPEAQEQVIKHASSAVAGRLPWHPNPGPQTAAYYSKADCLLYGGAPGGGKSQLLLGCAFNCHQRSLIMRREYGGLERLIADALKLNGGREGFNGSPPPRLRISDTQTIYFRAAHNVGDEQGIMGQGRDFLGIDEATQFAESQVRFIMGWNRTEDPAQRCRTILATNPPLTAEGFWINEMFGPWLNDAYHNPAEQGELRWVLTDEDGTDLWVDGPDDCREIRGKLIKPTSRSYIESHVEDNPEYAKTDYERTLEGMPEPYRSILLGGFKTHLADDAFQVMPSEWVREAMKRHTPLPPSGIPMTAMGVDVAISIDQTVLSPRYDYWYAPLIVVPGVLTPSYSQAAALVVQHRKNNAAVVVDVGGGYGGGVVECLKENGIESHQFNAATAGWGRTKDGSLAFANKRAEAHWRFREALDPSQEFGSPVMLPDDAALLADLTAPRFKVTTRGVLIESKEEIKKRLGRSTDRGDAVVMAWSEGVNALVGRLGSANNKMQTRAIMGPRGRR